MRQRVFAAMLGMAAMFQALTGGPAGAQDLQAHEHVIRVGGIERTYLLHVPVGMARPTAVVMVFHGGGGTAQGIMRTTRMNDIANQQHFIVVYPEGIGRARGGTWNIGGPESPSSADDLGFVQAILAELEQHLPIDHRRIYATGESMGGVFSYRLACEMSETFAAIAPVAATMVEPGCAPRSPVAVFHVHGTADQNIPIGGGAGLLTARGRSWPPIENGLSQWAQFDHCATPPSSTQDGPETTCYSYNRCQTSVEFCLIRGGGHAWPGSEPHRWQQLFGVYVSQTFPTSARTWAFFAAHPKS